MVVGGGLGLVGEGGGKPNKQRRLSSRDLMQQNKTKPKKRKFAIGLIIEFQIQIKILTLELENLACRKNIGIKVGLILL
jgi:hypothetical protein